MTRSLAEGGEAVGGGYFYEVEGVVGEGVGEGCGEFVEVVDAGGGGAVGFGEFDEVGVAEVGADVASVEGVALDALENAPCVIVEDEDDGADAVLEGGADFLDVVLEAAVAGDDDDLLVGAADFGAEAGGEAEAEAGPGVGAEVGVRFVEVHAAGGAVVGDGGVADDYGVAVEDAADAFEGSEFVGVLVFQAAADALFEFGDFVGVGWVGGDGFGFYLGEDLLERDFGVSNHTYGSGVVLADFGGVYVYLDDVFGEGEALWMVRW